MNHEFTSVLRIGTRASSLALWQAQWVAQQVQNLGAEARLVEIATRGDQQRAGPIAAMGTTGVFTKEIQLALLEGQVDVAVHSLKDLPTETMPGLKLAAVPARELEADALVTHVAPTLAELPRGARVGTGSLRRQAQVRQLRPDLEVLGIRGNVDTRLRKLDAGEYDAVILAAAGLRRLNLAYRIAELLAPPRLLPAVGQGALGLECRAEETPIVEFLGQLDHPPTHQATAAERAMLALLHGGCSAPVGAWGRMEAGHLQLDGLVASVSGETVLRATAAGPPATATAIGRAVAEQLLADGAAEIIAAAQM